MAIYWLTGGWLPLTNADLGSTGSLLNLLIRVFLRCVETSPPQIGVQRYQQLCQKLFQSINQGNMLSMYEVCKYMAVNKWERTSITAALCGICAFSPQTSNYNNRFRLVHFCADFDVFCLDSFVYFDCFTFPFTGCIMMPPTPQGTICSRFQFLKKNLTKWQSNIKIRLKVLNQS